MQAVILAAGQSARLYPFADGVNKTMVTLLGKPLLFYTLQGLKEVGITDIVIVVDKTGVIQNYFGNGKTLGLTLNYVIQSEPLGMGNGVLQAQELIHDDFLLLHGHHIDCAIFIPQLLAERKTNILLAEQREDTWKYGVLQIKGNKVENLVEKPKKGDEPSKLCVVGIYILSKNFFPVLKETPMEQYQFEKALSDFAKQEDISVVTAKEKTLTLKYPWDLFAIKDYLLSHNKPSKGKNITLGNNAIITEDITIGDNTTIMEGATIKGPCYIGNNVTIGTNAIVRNGSVVEDNCVIGAQMELRNTIIMEGTTTHSGFIGDSLIGKDCKIAAQFCTGNVRLDRKIITTVVKNEAIDTGRTRLGVMIGNQTKIGINVSTMPGVIIGKDVVIGPSTTIEKNIPDSVTYYTKFHEIIEKK